MHTVLASSLKRNRIAHGRSPELQRELTSMATGAYAAVLMRTYTKAVCSAALVVALALGAQAQSKSAPPEPKVKVGDVAPDFTLTDQAGKQVSLRDFRGKKNVALAFYVFAFTGG